MFSSQADFLFDDYHYILQIEGNSTIFANFNFIPLQNLQFRKRPKLKTFAVGDDEIYITEILKFSLGRVENIAGKRENTVYQDFLLFLQCFKKLPSQDFF